MSFKTLTPFLRGRTYYFRLRVPQDLLPVYDPKKELTFSLKTRDFIRLWRTPACVPSR